MFQGLTGWHLLIILAIVVLLFGATKLPGLAKSVGQSMRVFKKEMKTMKDEEAESGATDHAAQPPSSSVSDTLPADRKAS